MPDAIRDAFLRRQFEEATALAASSDILRVVPLSGSPPDRYAIEFMCKGLIRTPKGEVVEADHFMVGVWFPGDYLRHAEPWQVLTWFGPRYVFHPNISHEAPFICVGRLAPGTSLVDLIYQCYEIISYKKVTMREDDALNKDACAWARDNRHRFPVDARPLKRRNLQLQVQQPSRDTV